MDRIALAFDRDQLRKACERWGIARLWFFGSVLRDDFRPDSDVDALVEFRAGRKLGIFEFLRVRDDLARVLGRRVDLLTRNGIESSTNEIRKRAILSTARQVYAA